MGFNIVLLEPEIPFNTGNIGRTCTLTGSTLHLIEPLGFKLTDKAIKTSGMDYWEHVNYRRYTDINDFYSKNPDAVNQMYMATTKAARRYSDVKFKSNDYIMFGKESKGIPEDILKAAGNRCITIPMDSSVMYKRSLNLSMSVSIILYEALRQIDYIF